MEKLILKIKDLGLWEVVNHNPETKYVQVEGYEPSKQKVKLWIPEAMAMTIAYIDELRKKKESMRKTADYFKNERNQYKSIATDLNNQLEELRKKHESLEESVEIMNFMSDDMSEEIQLKFHRHKVINTIIGFIAIMEAVGFLSYYLIMQK